jgi:hypothetical protein
MLCVYMLSVIMLSIVMLSVIKLRVVMLRVVASLKDPLTFEIKQQYSNFFSQNLKEVCKFGE